MRKSRLFASMALALAILSGIGYLAHKISFQANQAIADDGKTDGQHFP